MKRKPSILIVDNDAFITGLYARKFEAEGWVVKVAERLAEAEKILVKINPSIILLEPDMDPDGAEKIVRSSNIPTVILTTLSEKAEIKRFTEAGARAYLLKGHFVPAEVVAKVKELVI